MGVAAEIRHRKILEQLGSAGRVYVREMSQALDVTEVTIRRDLTFLQNNGLVKKSYGGAVPVAPELETSVRYRQTRRLEAKKIIGKLASRLIKDGNLIYLEAGSTCYEIIPHLSDRKGLTIIVNSLYLMRRLHELARHKIIIIGGDYRPNQMDMVGPQAKAAISQLSGFKAFTGADNITIDDGISEADVVTVEFIKTALKKAGEIIFVGDHTKFDNPALYKIADIDELDYIVTDTRPSKAWHKAASKKNVKLIYPK